MAIQSRKSDQARLILEGRSPGKGFAGQGLPGRLGFDDASSHQRRDAATMVEDLRTPPRHRLHRLDGDRAGQWSISVNDQFRITFVCGAAGPEDVWFGDYH